MLSEINFYHENRPVLGIVAFSVPGPVYKLDSPGPATVRSRASELRSNPSFGPGRTAPSSTTDTVKFDPVPMRQSPPGERRSARNSDTRGATALSRTLPPE